MTQTTYKWATLGTGVIANELAQALQALGGNLYSVANRTYDKGRLLRKNTASKKFIIISMRSLKTLRLISFISQPRTIHTLTICVRP